MGMKTCTDYIRGYNAEQLSKCNVVLIHTSQQNGAKELIKEHIEKELGLIGNVYVPTNGTTIKIDKTPF